MIHTFGRSTFLAILIIGLTFSTGFTSSPKEQPELSFTISFPRAEDHSYQVEFYCSGLDQDVVFLKLPNWMPGYYQMMDYYKNLGDLKVRDNQGNILPVKKTGDNSWKISGAQGRPFMVSYAVHTKREFVPCSYVDSERAYLAPGNTFVYIEGMIQAPVKVKLELRPEWKDVASGLEELPGKSHEYVAPDFDFLYDCPILAGNLEELPSFYIQGIEHRFVGYRLGEFDKVAFMDKLEKAVIAATEVIGEIPYNSYTFIAIGPGRGGIEHLNNTTFGFDSRRMNTPRGLNGMLSFLVHEYFHLYNVKRIRPYELGPFDYDNGSRTNLLWLAEGFTVYYETRIMKNAGLIDREDFLSEYLSEIDRLDKDSGRFHQSLIQASYNTWEEGPFGDYGNGPDRSISVYNKGAVFALLLDLQIRHSTENRKTLDDIMQLLYRKYYKEKKRGFTDAEFQRACEELAGTSLAGLFNYAYTTEEIDYNKYLGYAGLGLSRMEKKGERREMVFTWEEEPDSLQQSVLSSWLGE